MPLSDADGCCSIMQLGQADLQFSEPDNRPPLFPVLGESVTFSSSPHLREQVLDSGIPLVKGLAQTLEVQGVARRLQLP